MSVAPPPPRLMTAEEFLALPDDGVERMLIDGVLYEKQEADMTVRNRFHSGATGNANSLLGVWRHTLPRPRGRVVNGDAGFILKRDPDVIVGIDVAYVDAAMAAANPVGTTLYEGPPLLAVEALSPNDTQQETAAKIRSFVQNGVRVVWIIDPDLQTVTVYKPGAAAAIYSVGQTLTGDPELPGFSFPVVDFFE